MRVFLVVLLAGLVSAALGIGATVAASHWLPSYDDAAGGALGEVFRLVFAVIYAVVGMTVFGFAARGGRSMTTVAWIMLALPLAMALIGSASDLMRLFGWYEIEKAFWSSLQIVAPLWSIIVVQWIIVQRFSRVSAPSR